MAVYFWVGGAGTWDNASNTHWSLSSGGAGGAGIPTTADTVNFDSSSGSGAVTIASTAACVACNFGASGITATLNANNTAGFAGTLTVTAGTFATSTFNLTLAGAFSITGGTFTSGGTFSTTSITSSGTTARTLTIGNCSGLSGATPINLSGSNCTFTHTSGTTITITVVSTTFNGNGYTFYNISNGNTAPTSLIINGANTFNNFTYGGRSSAGISTITLNANQTINGTLSINNSSTAPQRRTQVVSGTYGSPTTITATAVTLSGVDFRDIACAGVASWSGTSIGDCGGNSGLTPSNPSTYYYNAAAGGWTGTVWATSPTGTPAATNFPLAQDYAVFTDNNPPSGTITLSTAHAYPTFDFSSRTLALSASFFPTNIYGSLILSSAITPTAATLTFSGRNKVQTIDLAGKSWNAANTYSAIGGTVRLSSAYTSTAAITIAYGEYDTNGYSHTSSAITVANGATLTLGASTVSLTAAAGFTANSTSTINAGTSTIALSNAAAKPFAGAGKTYYNLRQAGAGALTVSGNNTFNNITNSTQPVTVTFTASSTNTFANFNLNGTAGNLVTINSSIAGTQFNLSKTSGTVSCDYLSIKDSNATGGASWYAGANSTNVSNNAGWIFTAPPAVANSNFLMFF